MAAGFPAPALLPIPTDGIIPVSSTLLNSTFDVIPPELREGTLHSWNVAFQRQLPFLLTADSRLRRQSRRRPRDGRRYQRRHGLRRRQRRPARSSPQFNRTGTSRTRTNDGKSRYDGLQMKVDRRFRNGLLVTNSYTLSRSMDYVNENTTHRHADRSSS